MAVLTDKAMPPPLAALFCSLYGEGRGWGGGGGGAGRGGG